MPKVRRGKKKKKKMKNKGDVWLIRNFEHQGEGKSGLWLVRGDNVGNGSSIIKTKKTNHNGGGGTTLLNNC